MYIDIVVYPTDKLRSYKFNHLKLAETMNIEQICRLVPIRYDVRRCSRICHQFCMHKLLEQFYLTYFQICQHFREFCMKFIQLQFNVSPPSFHRWELALHVLLSEFVFLAQSCRHHFIDMVLNDTLGHFCTNPIAKCLFHAFAYIL